MFFFIIIIRPSQAELNFLFSFVITNHSLVSRAQDLFSIKKAKADSITQKIMMDLMMKMMSEVRKASSCCTDAVCVAKCIHSYCIIARNDSFPARMATPLSTKSATILNEIEVQNRDTTSSTNHHRHQKRQQT